jgi:hypothetical protein
MRAAPEAALPWLDARPLSTSSDNLRTAAVEAMAETNPAAALEMMKARGWNAQHPGAVLRLLSNWGGRDPMAALDAMRALQAEMGQKLQPEGPEFRQFSTENLAFRSMLQALLYGAFQRSPSDAAALLASLSSEELSAGRDAVAGEIFSRDPSASDALFVLRPDERTRQLLLSLAGLNPAATLNNLGRLDDLTLRKDLLRALGNSYFDSDTAVRISAEAQNVVRETLAGITAPEEKADVAQRLCFLTAALEPAWAAELWTDLPAKNQYQSAHQFIASAGRMDPQSVLDAWSASPREVQTQSLKSLCFALGASAPDAALNLVLQRSEPELRAECAATLFAVWSARDTDGALVAFEKHIEQFDPAAILRALPKAGEFRIAYRTDDGSGTFSTHESVNTAKLRAHLQQLSGSAPSDP